MKQNLRLIVTFLCFFLTAMPANAADLELSDAWTRQPLAGAMANAVYLTIKNTGSAADSLVKMETPAADIAEVHTMKMEGDIMRMRQVKELSISAGEAVVMEPGGMHIMLMKLKEIPAMGERFPLTLTFSQAGEISVDVIVKK